MHKEDLDAAETLVCGESAPLCYGRFVSLQHKAVVHSWEEGLAQGGSTDAEWTRLWNGEPPRYRCYLGCILLKMPAISWLTGKEETTTEDKEFLARWIFSQGDRDEDGELTLDEASQLINAQDVATAFDGMDGDGDGRVGFEGFRGWYVSQPDSGNVETRGAKKAKAIGAGKGKKGHRLQLAGDVISKVS